MAATMTVESRTMKVMNKTKPRIIASKCESSGFFHARKPIGATRVTNIINPISKEISSWKKYTFHILSKPCLIDLFGEGVMPV